MTDPLSRPSSDNPSPLPLVALCVALGIASPAVKGAITLLFPVYPRVVFSYLVIFLVVLAMTLLSVRIGAIVRNRVVHFATLLVGVAVIHHLVMSDADLLTRFKELVQYKLILGLGTAVQLYLMIRQLILAGRSRILRRVMGAWFAFLVVLNLTILIVGVLGLVPVTDPQILENNRAAFEIFAVGLMWTLLAESEGGHSSSWGYLGTPLQAAVIAITLIAMAYSTRSVQVSVLFWLTVLTWRALSVDRVGLSRLILPVVTLVVLGTATVHPVSNVVRIIMIEAGGPTLARVLDDNLRAINLVQNRIPDELLEFIRAVMPQAIDESGVLRIPKSAISTISRIVQIVDAMSSLVENPTGLGYVLNRDTTLGYSNHAMFFVLIKAYGVFWVLIFVGMVVAWRRMASHWLVLLPLGVNMLFMPNVMASALLAVSVRPGARE